MKNLFKSITCGYEATFEYFHGDEKRRLLEQFQKSQNAENNAMYDRAFFEYEHDLSEVSYPKEYHKIIEVL